MFMYYYFENTDSIVPFYYCNLTEYLGKFFYWETGYFNTLDITLNVLVTIFVGDV